MSLRVEAFAKKSYERTVRWTVLTACLLGLAGCFNPTVKDGGFACSSTDTPPCPSGFFCVSGYCVKNPGQTVAPADLAMASAPGDLASSGGGGSDFSSSTMPQDLAQPPGADLATPPMCGASNAPCSKAADCCSKVCFLVLCI